MFRVVVKIEQGQRKNSILCQVEAWHFEGRSTNRIIAEH